MQCVILCGGFATRLGDLCKFVPKSMLVFNNKPFLSLQLELLKKNGIKNIVLLTGHLEEQIINYFGKGKKFKVNIRYSKGNQYYGTGFALKRAKKLLEKEFCVLYGDSYLPINYKKVINFFDLREELALMTVFKNNDKYDKSNVDVKNGFVINYDLDAKKSNHKHLYIDYGFSIFRRKALNLVPKDTNYKLGQLFKDLALRHQLLAFEVKERFYEIGSFAGINDLKKLLEGE